MKKGKTKRVAKAVATGAVAAATVAAGQNIRWLDKGDGNPKMTRIAPGKVRGHTIVKKIAHHVPRGPARDA